MTTLVLLLTAFVIATAAGFGAWRGARRMLRSLVVLGVAAIAAAGIGVLAYRRAWFAPLGLITPAALGLLVLLLVGGTIARCWRPRTDPVSPRDRALGSVLGACGGVLLAAELWLIATCAAGVAEAAQRGPDPRRDAAPASISMLQALVRTANRGFIQHLPLLGELGDEVEATVYILNAPVATRDRFARLQQQWLDLTELDSYRELTDDAEVAADLEAFRGGDVLALYRLQANPRFLAFFMEDKVQSLLPSLRPSTLAQELAAASARDHR